MLRLNAHSKMKFPCIFFAIGIYIAAFAMVDTIATQVKGYGNLDEFLRDVKTTADILLDYVIKMQALFCPNQPVCGADGELERKDVLGTLPAVMSIGDVSVNVGDIADSVDVCCLPCSCSDSCWKVNNCCTSKQLYPDTSKNSTTVEQECIAASVVSYRDKLKMDASHANHMFRMVTTCFLDNSNLTIVDECQNPDPDALSNNIPVTSQKTGYTYWNKPCATCNDDEEDIIEWIPYAIIKTNIRYFSNSSSHWRMPYPDTYKALSNLLNARRFSDIMYIPPENIVPERHKCMRDDLLHLPDCMPTLDREGSSTPDWLVESCRHIYSPVKYGPYNHFFKNIFCVACDSRLQLITNKPTCQTEDPIKASPGYLTTLLNYKLEPDHAAPLKIDDKCNCAEMFDPYLNLCRPLYCSSGEIKAGCHCIQPFRQLSGMPVAIMVKVTSRQDGPDSLTSGQQRKLHIALENALETIAVNTTATIASTLQQENTTSLTYLCIVIVYSYLGTDTKLAMRPFLEYLDKDEVIELSVGKLELSASLTTNARLWTEWEVNWGTFRACCLDQRPNQLVQLYADKDVVGSSQIGRGVYQPMSRLLYCKQVELDETEHYITDSGIVNINVTKPMIAISDYRPVSASRIRVCADVYVPKTPENGKGSMGVFCACLVEVMILSLLSVVVTCIIN